MLEHVCKRPSVDPSGCIAPNAVICGDVGRLRRAAITAESSKMTIGENCVVMDTAVIRGVRDNTVSIAENVVIGPRPYVVGCPIESEPSSPHP